MTVNEVSNLPMNRASRPLGSIVFVAAVALSGCQSGPVVGNAPLATGQVGVGAIAADDFYVYWTLDSGEVHRVARDGGKVETIATGPGKRTPSSIAIDATDVYWTMGDGTVAHVAKAGGDVKVLAIVPDAHDIALDEKHVYFAAGGTSAGAGTIQSVAKTASIDVPTVMVATQQDHPHQLAVSGTLIWATGTDQAGAIAQVAPVGGSVTSLVSQVAPHNLSVAAGHLAWTETATGAIRASALDGTQLRDLAVIDPSTDILDTIVSDDANVYFTTTGGTVQTVSLASGNAAPEVMVTGTAGGQTRLAVDANTLYVGNSQDGVILALPKR